MWEFPSVRLIVARSHLLSKALSLCISKGRMSEWKLSLVSNLFSHPSTIHPLNLQAHLCSVQQQASVKSSRRLFFTGTPNTYLFCLFLILNVRQRIRKFCSPSSSSSKCVSRWMKCIKKACFVWEAPPGLWTCVRPDYIECKSVVCEPCWAVCRKLQRDLWTVALSVSQSQVVNCWYTQLYVMFAVLCSFIRGGGVGGCKIIQRCYCMWKRAFFCCCRVGSGGRDAVPHGKWSSQYIYTSFKPLLKTDDCSFRAQWISINILNCSNWLCAIVMMEIQ